MSLYDVLLERMDGHEYNNYFVTCCPYHKEKHPSFFVYEDGSFRCASCGKRGNLKQLDRFTGSHFIPVREKSSNILPNWRKWGDSLDEIAEVGYRTLKKYPQFRNYYNKRKIDDEIIEKNKFGYRDGWALLPVYSSEHCIVDIVVRAIRGKGDTRYVVKPGNREQRPLFCPNWDRVMMSDTVYVPFGIFDAVSFEMIGLASVTGITGKSINPDPLKALQKRIILVPDAGEESDAHKLANLLGWKARVKELRFPEQTKDPSGIREVYGLDVLKEMFA